MEKVPGQYETEGFIPFEQSLQMARKLMEDHEDELINIRAALPEEDREAIRFNGSSIEHHLNKFPKETLKRFWGHGIFRGDAEKNLAALINVIQNKSIKGSIATLVDSGYYDAAKDGDFLVLSHADTTLAVLNENGKPIFNEIGLVINAGAYVVNAKLYPIIDDLKVLFPDANILMANEVPEYVNSETGV